MLLFRPICRQNHFRYFCLSLQQRYRSTTLSLHNLRLLIYRKCCRSHSVITALYCIIPKTVHLLLSFVFPKISYESLHKVTVFQLITPTIIILVKQSFLQILISGIFFILGALALKEALLQKAHTRGPPISHNMFARSLYKLLR